MSAIFFTVIIYFSTMGILTDSLKFMSEDVNSTFFHIFFMTSSQFSANLIINKTIKAVYI